MKHMACTRNQGSGLDSIPLQRLKDLALHSDGHAFDKKTGHSYRLNHTGLQILQWIHEGLPENSLVSQLAARYGQHPSVVIVGIDAFCSQIRRHLS